MVSTLRITSVAAVIIAGLLLVLVAGPKSLVPKLLAKFAIGSDEEIDRILEAPSVVDMFRENQGSRSVDTKNATPPLVSQAEAFARIINPPKPVSDTSTKNPPDRKTLRPPTPVPVSSRFALVGTSYVASDPEGSFAYIRLPDKTHQWVRKGDEVGHQVIKEIKHGAIVYSDGHSDVEMIVEDIPETASFLEGGYVTAPPVEKDEQGKAPAQPVSGRITGRPVPRPWGRESADPNLDDVRRDNMDELVDRIRKAKAAGTGLDHQSAEIQKLIAEYKADKSSRVSEEEAEKLDDLGRELNESEKAPARSSRVNINRKLTVPRARKE